MSQYDRFPMQGGLDLSTPYVSRTPGTLLQSLNYECDTDGGYRVMGGYERYDGRRQPSGIVLYELTFTTPIADVDTTYLGAWTIQPIPPGSSPVLGFVQRVSPSTAWMSSGQSGLPKIGDTFAPAAGGSYVIADISQVLVDANNTVGITYPDGFLVKGTNLSTAGTSPVVGATITGTAGANVATGVVRALRLNPNDANLFLASLFYISLTSGRFAPGMVLTFSGATDTFTAISAGDLEEYLQDPSTPQGALYAVQEYFRSNIREVPGLAGTPVRGVANYVPPGSNQDDVYAIRDFDTTTARLYRSSANGWVNVPLGFTLNWDNRPSTIDDTYLVKGAILRGATSNAQATVGFVGYTTPDHSAGFVTMQNITGTFQDNETLTVGAAPVTNVGLVNGVATANVLPAGGTYRFFEHNFYAGTNTYWLFGVNGVGAGWVFDGGNFSFVQTGLPPATNKPFEVKVHYDHLFYAFEHGSLQHSVVGNPLDWSGSTGALELGIGAEITDLIITPKSLIICTEKDVQTLLGTGVDTWTKDIITSHTGVKKFTGQYQSMSYVAARPGLMAIDRVDTFGNFADSVISDKIRDLIAPRYDLWGLGVADKTKSQYRLYGTDSLNLVFTIYQGELKGITTFSYGIPVRQVSNPQGRFFFCSDTGYVYQSDVGGNNDGEERAVYVRTSYSNQGDPDTRKRFRRAAVSVSGSIFREMVVSFTFDKGRSVTPNSFIKDTLMGAGGRWALNDWDRVYWDGPDVEEIRKDMDGVGSDVSMIVYQTSRAALIHILEDVTFEYEPRRKVR